MCQEGNLHPVPHPGGSVHQSLFLDFLARQRNSNVGASLLSCFQSLMILMKNSYKNTWFVFTKTAKEQRKMKTGSCFYPEAFSPVILGLLSLCELCPPQEISSGQNRDPKKKKRHPLGPVESDCQLYFVFWGCVY